MTEMVTSLEPDTIHLNHNGQSRLTPNTQTICPQHVHKMDMKMT